MIEPTKRHGPVGWLLFQRRWQWIPALLVAYALAVGPLSLVCRTPGCPVWFVWIVETTYTPLVFVVGYSPEFVRYTFDLYMRVWVIAWVP